MAYSARRLASRLAAESEFRRLDSLLGLHEDSYAELERADGMPFMLVPGRGVLPIPQGGALGQATVTNPPAGQTSAAQGKTSQKINFRRSTRHHWEPFFDKTVTLTASAQGQPPIYVPAYGFLRGIWIELNATGGSGTTTSAVGNGDSPFDAIQTGVFDVNGAPIYFPLTVAAQGNYFSFLAMKYGAYSRQNDGRSLFFSAVATTGNFTCLMYIPIELIKRSGLGAITNLNAAASYQVFLNVQAASAIYTTNPSPTLPNLRVRMWLDAWGQPPPHDILGNMTSPTPPALNTTQFWALSQFPVVTGSQITRLTRLGQYVRTLIFALYSGATPARDDADWPDPAEIWLDDVQVASIGKDLWKEFMASWYNLNPNSLDTAGGLDTGVFAFPFTDDAPGLVLGNELRNGYLPTLQSSRLELRGTYGGGLTSANLFVITNDVAPAGDIFSVDPLFLQGTAAA